MAVALVVGREHVGGGGGGNVVDLAAAEQLQVALLRRRRRRAAHRMRLCQASVVLEVVRAVRRVVEADVLEGDRHAED